MDIKVVTLFPEMFVALTESGVTGRALEKGLWRFSPINPRRHSGNRHGYVDKRPYGGGPGMTMRAEPLYLAVKEALSGAPDDALVIAPTPQGRPVDQRLVEGLSRRSTLVFVCGRYEGIDERFYRKIEPLEVSVGDLVVSGGELPAMMIVDAVLRLIPGVLGCGTSAELDSFRNGLLEGPQYTHPPLWEGMEVPSVLTSGHHAQIDRWRLKQAILRTWTRRPDLFYQHVFNPEEAGLLMELWREGSIPEEALRPLGRTPGALLEYRDRS